MSIKSMYLDSNLVFEELREVFGAEYWHNISIPLHKSMKNLMELNWDMHVVLIKPLEGQLVYSSKKKAPVSS